MSSAVSTNSVARATDLATAIRAKVPVMALLGGSTQFDKVAAAIKELASGQIGFIRIGSPLGLTLSLEQLVTQICGGRADDDRDPAEGVLRALIARSDMRRQLVVIVEQAETLSPEALEFLHGLPEMGHPSLALVQVALVGGAAFGARIADQRIYVIGGSAAPAAPAAILPPTVAVAAKSPEVARPGRRGAERYVLAGLGVCAVGAVLFMLGVFQPGATPPVPATTRVLAPIVADAAPAVAVAQPPSAPSAAEVAPAPVAAGMEPSVAAPSVAPVSPPIAAVAEPSVAAPQQAAASAPEQAAAAAKPGPSGGQQVTALTPEATDASPRAAAAVPAPPVQPVVEDAATARARLYREFIAFTGSRGLGRRLSPAERAALFQEYLARRQGAPALPAAGAAESSRIPGDPHLLVLFAAGSDADREAAEQQGELLQDRVAGLELEAQAEVPSVPTIRYAFAADRPAALALAEIVPAQGGTWQVEDMTATPNRAVPGTIELWLPRRS